MPQVNRPRFRRRFMLLSGALHAAPLALPLALPSLTLRLCEEPVPRELLPVALVEMARATAAPAPAHSPTPQSQAAQNAQTQPVEREQAQSAAREQMSHALPADEATPMAPAAPAGAPGVPSYLDGIEVLTGMRVGVSPSSSSRVEAEAPSRPLAALVEQSAPARPAQDRERAVAAIAERVAKVLPLVFWDAQRKQEVVGVTVVRLRLNRYGYVEWSEVSGADPRLVPASYAALHLAEPFVYVPGVIEIELTFYG